MQNDEDKYNVNMKSALFCSHSVQSLDRLGRQGDMRDDSAEILFQSFLVSYLRKKYFF